MSIEVHFSTGTVIDLHAEMRALLEGDGRSTTAISTGTIAPNGASAGGVGVGQQAGKEKPASGRTRAGVAAAAALATGKAASNISTGEERVDPEADKQDAADEAVETAAAKIEPAKLTHDDVKKVLGAHVQAYGMAASQADVKVLLNGAEKLSATPDTQPALAAAIISIADAIEKNPRKHDIAGDGLEAATIAAITPLVQAARAVK